MKSKLDPYSNFNQMERNVEKRIKWREQKVHDVHLSHNPDFMRLDGKLPANIKKNIFSRLAGINNLDANDDDYSLDLLGTSHRTSLALNNL